MGLTAVLRRERRVIANTGWLLLDRVLRLAVGMFVTVWVARYLGPIQLGILSYAMAWVGMFAALSGICNESIIVRDLIREPGSASEVLGTARVLRGAGSVVAGLIALLTATLFSRREPDTLLIILVLATLPFLQSIELFSVWFQAKVSSGRVVLARLVSFAAIAAVRVSLITFRAPLVLFAACLPLEAALTYVGLSVVYRRDRSRPQNTAFRAARAKELVRESWPLMISVFAIFVYMRIDQVLVKLLSSEHECGLYAAAVRFTEVWFVVPGAIVQSVMPRLVSLTRVGEAAFLQGLSRLFRLLVLMSYAFAALMTVISRPLIQMAFGAQFAGAAPILAVHVWAGVFVALGCARSLWDTTQHATRFNMYSTIGGGIVNVLLNLLLVPRYGGVGSAIATLVSYSYAGVFACLVHRQARRVGWLMLRSLALLP